MSVLVDHWFLLSSGNPQFYGGLRCYKDGKVRVVELRFYLRIFTRQPIYSIINSYQDYRVQDREQYMSFKFSNYNEDVKKFVADIIGILGTELAKFYGERYPAF